MQFVEFIDNEKPRVAAGLSFEMTVVR